MEGNNRFLPLLGWTMLIPLVFLGHAYNENFGLVAPAVVLGLLVQYEVLALLGMLIGWGIQRNSRKAYLFTALLLIIYLTFGTLQDWVRSFPIALPIARYRLLLPLFAGALVLFASLLKRSSSPFLKSVVYLKWLTVVCLVWELGHGISQGLSSPKKSLVKDQQESIYRALQIKPTASSQLPHVIWLILDMYPSSASLQEAWQFSNPLDDWLRQQGFFVARHAQSSYNYTPFSISAELNMHAFDDYTQGDAVQAKDQVSAILRMKSNPVFRFFQDQQYRIDNYSLFDYAASPTRGWTFFGDLPERLLNDRTLLASLKRDIGWKLDRSLLKTTEENDSIQIHREVDRTHARYQELIQNWQGSLVSIKDAQQPVFSVFHVMLPHEPFLYDSSGALIYRSYNTDPSDFIGQVMHTNVLLKEWIRQCLALQDQRRLLLIVQGDHGYKYEEEDRRFTTESNRILLAVYDSQQQYDQWTEEVNGTDLFRILLNQYFGQHLPLEKGSTVQLRYRN